MTNTFKHSVGQLWEKKWLIGLGLLVISVCLGIHGSSIGLYADILGHKELNSVLLGENRPIRSDEWVVFTPFAFSQYYNNFAYFSNIVRGTLTDMFIVYGQPVWDVGIVFRPAQWGYLFLNKGAGLAFFWMGRLIILCLVSIEFGMLITRNRKLSISYGLLLALSPLVQWWFSVNSLVEILAAGQGMVVLWHNYLLEGRKKYRRLYIFGILWCIGIYCLAIYPAWQVSFGYVFLVLFFWVYTEHKEGLLYWREDWMFWGICLVALVWPLVHVLLTSLDTIKITKLTEYPGTRFVTGGHLSLGYLFSYANSIFLPFKDILKGSNNSEMASIFSLAPLGWFMAGWLYMKHKTTDRLANLLILLNIVFLAFSLFGFPAWLAKITLMSNVPESRLRSAIEFINLILLFRMLPLFRKEEHEIKWPFLIIPIFIGVLAAVCGHAVIPNYVGWKKFIFEIILVGIMSVLFLQGSFKKILCSTGVLMLLIGITVNPLARGTKCIYELPVGKAIAKIVSQDKGLWMVDHCGTALNDFPIMFGAPTINSVNTYPHLALWEKLDQGENKKIYNRYAHIEMNLQHEGKTKFSEGNGDDNFRINLPVDKLPILKVRYILTREKLEKLDTHKVKFKRMFTDKNIYIYKAIYQEAGNI